MADAPTVPRACWLFGRGERRRKAWDYWIRDTAQGILNFFLHYATRAMPIDVCSQLGSWMGSFGRLRHPEAEAPLRQLWAALRPDENPADVEADIARLWRCVGRTVAEFSVIDRLWVAGRITVDGIEHLDSLRAEGKRRLLIGLHLGNWETVLPTLTGFGHSGTGIYTPPQNRFDHVILVKSRARCGFKLVEAGASGALAARRVVEDEQRHFHLMVDEFVRGRVQAPAFGRDLREDSNLAYAARLAALTGCEIIPCFSLRLGEQARFKVTFMPPITLRKSENAIADRKANIARLNTVIEPIVRANLDQWYFGLYYYA